MEWIDINLIFSEHTAIYSDAIQLNVNFLGSITLHSSLHDYCKVLVELDTNVSYEVSLRTKNS